MIPGWLPEGAVTYLAHTAAGLPIRALARARGCHASTVLRQIRRIEAWRDDPLIDEALERMARDHAADLRLPPFPRSCRPCRNRPSSPPTPRTRASSARRGASCAGSARRARSSRWRRAMEKAVVLREVVPGKQNRIAVVDRDVAHAFALQEWIGCDQGRQDRLLRDHRGRAGGAEAAADRGAGGACARARQGFEEAQAPFQEQHRFFAERTVMAEDGSGERQLRFNLAESPLSVLGRKRDKDGAAYLGPRADRGGRAAARGLRAGADGAAGDAELGAVPDRRRHARRRPAGAGRPRGRRTRGCGSPRRWRRWGRGSRTSCSASAASWKGLRQRRNGSAGRRARARWC